jgi:hypothetical protein
LAEQVGVRCGGAAGSDGVFRANEIRGSAEVGFDWLRAQLDSAQAELHAVRQRVVAGDRVAAEAVRHVDTNLHAGDLGVRLAPGGCRFVRGGQ